MDAKTIIILILIGFIWYTYSNPDKGIGIIDTGVEKVSSVVGDIPLGNLGPGEECGNIEDPVCAEGTTYLNACLAQQAGHTEMTEGECEE